jgi:hypothetical protein
MDGHSGDIAAAVMIGAAIMLALVLSAKADALSAQPSQIIHELRQQQTGKQAKPLKRLARTPDQLSGAEQPQLPQHSAQRTASGAMFMRE